MQVLGDRPGQREPVERAGPPPDFVEQEQRPRRRLVENPRALRHLHHEGALPARQIVRRADAREQPIDEADARALRGNERSRLRQHDDESHLPHGGALPRHVGTGEHHQSPFRVERQIVGYERALSGRSERALHHRMPSLHHLDHVGLVDDGPHPPGLRRHPRE